jgi:multidrug efflux pump
VLPEIQRIKGVGQAQLFGTERAMRIWIDPAKLVGFNLSPADVNNAIRSPERPGGVRHHRRPAAGQGPADHRDRGRDRPAVDRRTVRQHRAARQPDGSTVRLKDVARIEIGGQAYATTARLNGKPSTGIGVQLSPSGNALETANLIKARMNELSKYFPPA